MSHFQRFDTDFLTAINIISVVPSRAFPDVFPGGF
jgi:hypothetical protein